MPRRTWRWAFASKLASLATVQHAFAEAARHPSLRRGQARWRPRVRRPSATTRSSRRSPARAARRSAPTRTPAWPARSAALLSAWAPPISPTRGSRATCASRCPSRCSSFSRAPRPGVCAKDVMLYLWRSRSGAAARGSARCSSSPATGSRALPLDERATLTNMAVEAGGFTGIIAADERSSSYLVTQRGLDADDARAASSTERSGRELRRHLRDRSLAKSSRWWPCPAIRATASRFASSPSSAAATCASTSPTAGRAPAARSPTWICTRRFSAPRSRGEARRPRRQLYLQFGSQEIRRYAEEQGLPRHVRKARAPS